jgi:hypothetical protein
LEHSRDAKEQSLSFYMFSDNKIDDSITDVNDPAKMPHDNQVSDVIEKAKVEDDEYKNATEEETYYRYEIYKFQAKKTLLKFNFLPSVLPTLFVKRFTNRRI